MSKKITIIVSYMSIKSQVYMWRGRSAYNVLNLIPHGEFMLGADSALFITLMSETPYLGMALTRQARRKQVKVERPLAVASFPGSPLWARA